MAHIDVSIEEWQYLPQHHVYVRQPTRHQANLELQIYWGWSVEVIVHSTFHFLVLDFVVEIRDSSRGNRYASPLDSYQGKLKGLLLLQVLEDARSVCYDDGNINRNPRLVLLIL
jgi:hypothetical protein